MPEKKFDLNKALQAAQLYTPVDYGYTPQFDIQTSQDNFNNTSNNVLSDIDWVGSGARARKEEQEKRDNTPWYSKLGYAAMSTPVTSGDVSATSALAADRYMIGDIEGGKEIQKMQDTAGSVAAGLSILGPYGIADFAKTAGTYGIGSALAAEGLSWGTGTAGYYGFNKLGQHIDNKRGTNIAPYLSLFGSLGTGIAGYSAGLKTAAGLARSAVNNGIRGYSDFKPALTDMMIKYTKPRKLGNVSFSPSESHIKIFNNRGSESGMDTYFKTDKYAGKTIDDIPVQTDYMQAPLSTPIFNPNGYEPKVWKWWFDRNKTINNNITVDDLKEYINSLVQRNGNNFSISAADMQLRKNFTDFIDDLTQSNTYHKALSVNDIMKEFDLMARKEVPINSANYTHINEYFEHDAFPRLMESFKRSGIDLKPEDASYIRRMYSHPFDGIKATIGYTSPGTGGFSRGTNLIRFSNRNSPSWENVKDDTIVHELHHSLRKRLAEYLRTKGYDINPGADWLPESLESWSASRNNGIRGSYLPSELETMKPLAMLTKFNADKTPAAEIGAVAAGDARFRAWSNLRKELGRIPTPKELNQRIDNYPHEPFYHRVQQLPYGKQIGSKAHSDFVKNSAWLEDEESLKAKNDFINSMAQSWKDAMKYIGGATGAAVGLNGINTQIENDEDYN